MEVATCEAPKFRFIHVFPVVGLVTSTIAVGPFAQKVLLAGYCAASEATLIARLQLWPPIAMANVALPAEAGVPVMVKLNVPAPMAIFPWESAAVNPVTPVEEMD